MRPELKLFIFRPVISSLEPVFLCVNNNLTQCLWKKVFSDLCSLFDRVIGWRSWRRPEISSRLPAWLRPTEENCSKFCLSSKRAVEQLFSAVTLTRSTGKMYSRTLSINCQSAAFIVRTLPSIGSKPRKNRFCATQLTQAWAQGSEERRKNTVFF